MKKRKNGKHVGIPTIIKYDRKTGEHCVLEYVELTDEEYDEQVIQPAARIFCNLLKRDIASGRFDEIIKESHEKE